MPELAVRSLAMQAGRVASELTLRDVSAAVAAFFSLLALLIRVRCRRQRLVLRLATGS